MTSCPSCESPQPHLHPSTGPGGEASICGDAFHFTPTPQNKAEYIERARAVTEHEL